MPERRTILLAEDDENDVFLLQRALQRAEVSLDLVVTRDGQEAVEFLGRTAPGKAGPRACEVALFLLDLKMPRLNGFDVLAWLAQQPQFKDLPAVVLSSSAHEADKERARKLGARDYRVKPADFLLLVEMIRELKARWLNGPQPVGKVTEPPG